MAQALIRNLDDELLADYRRAAKRNAQSLEAELRDGLARARPKQHPATAELETLTHELWKLVPDSARQDSGPLIRAMRDSS